VVGSLAMPKIELLIRRLDTEEVLEAEFASEDECEAWLVERPDQMEVVKMLSKVDAELEARLRQAMRPLDLAEVMRRDQINAAKIAEARAARQQAEAAAGAEPAETEDEDPQRAMVVRWSTDKGLYLADEADKREIPERVRDAMQAWIDERNTWVRDRGQYVSAAIATVEIIEDYDGDRVHPGGRFVTSDRDPESV
jgi:hypothetical protein